MSINVMDAFTPIKFNEKCVYIRKPCNEVPSEQKGHELNIVMNSLWKGVDMTNIRLASPSLNKIVCNQCACTKTHIGHHHFIYHKDDPTTLLLIGSQCAKRFVNDEDKKNIDIDNKRQLDIGKMEIAKALKETGLLTPEQIHQVNISISHTKHHSAQHEFFEALYCAYQKNHDVLLQFKANSSFLRMHTLFCDYLEPNHPEFYFSEIVAAMQNTVVAPFLPTDHAEIQAIIDGGRPDLSKEYQDALNDAITKFEEASKPMMALAFLLKNISTRCEKELPLWAKAQSDAAKAAKESQAQEKSAAVAAELAVALGRIAELEAQLASKRRKVEV